MIFCFFFISKSYSNSVWPTFGASQFPWTFRHENYYCKKMHFCRQNSEGSCLILTLEIVENIYHEKKQCMYYNLQTCSSCQWKTSKHGRKKRPKIASIPSLWHVKVTFSVFSCNCVHQSSMSGNVSLQWATSSASNRFHNHCVFELGLALKRSEI